MIAPRRYDLLFLILNKNNKEIKRIAKEEKKPIYSIKVTQKNDKPKTSKGVIGMLKFF